MIRRLSVAWPDPRPFAGRDARPIRILAVADDVDRALASPENRRQLEPIELVLGCGDLEPDYLALLADAYAVRLLYVRGNHDRGLGWEAAADRLPRALEPGRLEDVDGLPVCGFEWPGVGLGETRPRPDLAWRHAVRLRLGLAARALVRAGRSPVPLVISHCPPRGLGDVATDAYHRGFDAYRWLVRDLRLPLWLHGHTPLAARPGWRVTAGATTVVNVSGAVLVELCAPASPPAGPPSEPDGRRGTG